MQKLSNAKEIKTRERLTNKLISSKTVCINEQNNSLNVRNLVNMHAEVISCMRYTVVIHVNAAAKKNCTKAVETEEKTRRKVCPNRSQIPRRYLKFLYV